MNGDTIFVETLERAYQVRFFGIDAPEMSQPYGNEARDFVSDLILSKLVTVEIQEKKGANLYIGDVFFKKRELSRLMLQKGYAWYNRGKTQYSFTKLEERAKRRQIGLWEEKKPVPPWMYKELEFLSNYGEKNRDPHEIVYVTLRGNNYHKIDCVHASGPITSYILQEAERFGYVPCPICSH